MIIFGRNTVREALLAGWGLTEVRLAVQSEKGKGLKDIIRLAGQEGIPVKFVNRPELSRLAESEAHQGVIAMAEDPREKTLEEVIEKRGRTGGGPLLLLDGVEDPRNFGAILRSALAAGAEGVVLTKHRAAPLSPAAVKASAGAAFAVPIARVTNLASAMDELRRRNYWIFGASAEAKTVIYDVDWADKSAIILGGEGMGLRELIRKKCDMLFRIPVNPAVESLNVSVAAGVILFEYKRKKTCPN